MAVSGTTTFNLVTNQIITEAFAEIGVKTINRDLTANEMQDGLTSLNLVAKSFISKGAFLWKTQQATLFLAEGQESYVLDGSTANATESYSETTLSANALSAATSISVTSATGFVIGYFIGIYLDDDSIQWTTISNIAGTTITLADALTDDAASGNDVFVYQTKLNRPEEIQNAQANTDSNQDIPMVQISRDTYYNIPTKDTSGRPNQFYYNKQLNSGIISLWPTPDSSTFKINFSFVKQLFDFASPVDSPDFPVEWLRPLILNLAYALSRKYGRFTMEERVLLKADAQEALEDVMGYDREDTSIYFQPASDSNINSYR